MFKDSYAKYYYKKVHDKYQNQSKEETEKKETI